jgi:hypothetical protein
MRAHARTRGQAHTHARMHAGAHAGEQARSHAHTYICQSALTHRPERSHAPHKSIHSSVRAHASRMCRYSHTYRFVCASAAAATRASPPPAQHLAPAQRTAACALHGATEHAAACAAALQRECNARCRMQRSDGDASDSTAPMLQQVAPRCRAACCNATRVIEMLWPRCTWRSALQQRAPRCIT